MKTLRKAIALLFFTCVVMALSASFFAGMANARADYITWADRVSRPTEPCGYCNAGTCTERIVTWPGVRGVGNLGIGNGNVSLMQPAFINDAMRSFNENLSKSATANNTTGDIIPAPGNNTQGNGTLVSRDISTGSGTFASPGKEEQEPNNEGPLTESLLPNDVQAASVITRAEPYTITVNKPYAHILNEDPVEPGALYGKMFGLPLPGGRVIDIGIKSLGSEY